MTAISLIAAFLIALVAAVASRGRADTRAAVGTAIAADPSAGYWHKRFNRMKLYALKKEKVIGLQFKEIRKIRALIPKPFWVPAAWKVNALCIHRHEAVNWHEKRNPASRGGMQIQYATWRSVGGRGDPADATQAEQLYRAYLIWKRDGGSWREWTTAGVCGLA